MNETFKKVIGQLRSVWNGMNFSAKFMSCVLLVGALVGLIVWANWIQKEEYGLLFSGQDTKEVAGALDYLKDNEIPYKIKDRGRSIHIPVGLIYETRLNLATEGLLDGKIGFEMFDKVQFGVTDFAQKINYRRALQGELSKTISQLEPVESANVQVVIPEESLFIEEKKNATASIVLKLKSNRSLTQQQVAGIVQLVSSGVEGLDAENVTITDNLGNLLTVKESSTMVSKNNEELDLKRRIEEYYVAKATELVSKVLGVNRSVVKVSAEMEYKNVEEKHVIYDPDRKVPKSQSVITRISGGPSRRGGVPGTDSNVRQVGLVQEIGENEEEETIQTQFDTSMVERLVSQHEGILKRLTVAILVDGKYETVLDDKGNELRKYVPLPGNMLDHIGLLVKNALGITDTRGDSIEIKNIQFMEDEKIDFGIKEKGPLFKMLMDNSSLIITIFTFLLFVMFVIKRLKGRVVKMEQELPALKGVEVDEHGVPLEKIRHEVEELQAKKSYEGIKEGMLKSAAMRDLIKKPGTEANQDLEIFKDDVRKQVQKKVEASAAVLRKWLGQ